MCSNVMYYSQPELLQQDGFALDKPFAEAKLDRQRLEDQKVVDVFN